VGFLPEQEVVEDFGPFAVFQEGLGFVPNLLRAQTLLPDLIEIEARLADAILFREGCLPRSLKESILLLQSHADDNLYCVTAHGRALESLGDPRFNPATILTDSREAVLEPPDAALLEFSLKLARHPTLVNAADIGRLRAGANTGARILDAILVVSLGRFFCTLSKGLDPGPDIEPAVMPPPLPESPPEPGGSDGFGQSVPGPRGYLQEKVLDPALPAAARLKGTFGFIPAVFSAQSLDPEVIAVEEMALSRVLFSDEALPRRTKQLILLAVSAANLNTYWVALQSELLRFHGVRPETADLVAGNHRAAGLPPEETALLDFSLDLVGRSSSLTTHHFDALRESGRSDEQILEAIVTCALSGFLNTLQMGLGVRPDFPARRVFPPERVHRPDPDPDAESLQRALAGDTEAIMTLVGRHHHRICRLLFGLLGDMTSAEEGTRRVFLAALSRLATSVEACTFRSWLVGMAIREGLERLPQSSEPGLSGSADGIRHEAGRIAPWVEPEDLYDAEELRSLVRDALRGVPPDYRLAVMLRDIEELSIEETADALGCDPTEVRARLHQGRMMLRDRLAPRFVGERGGFGRA